MKNQISLAALVVILIGNFLLFALFLAWFFIDCPAGQSLHIYSYEDGWFRCGPEAKYRTPPEGPA